MMSLVNKWASVAQHKVSELAATVTSGALIASDVSEELTLSEWSTILGMIYIASMLAPRVFWCVKWVYKKYKTKK